MNPIYLPFHVGIAIRDRIAQPVADASVRRFGVGPFSIATVMLRGAIVLAMAKDTSALVGRGNLTPFLADALWLYFSFFYSAITDKASRTPPKGGASKVTELHSDTWAWCFGMVAIIIIPFGFAMAWPIGWADIMETSANMIQFGGMLFGSCIWRDLPRNERRSYNFAPAT